MLSGLKRLGQFLTARLVVWGWFTARAITRHFGLPRPLMPTPEPCCSCSWQLLPLINFLLAFIFSHSTSSSQTLPFPWREEVGAVGAQVDAACTFYPFPWAAAVYVVLCCMPLHCHCSTDNYPEFHSKTALCCRLVDELRTRNGRWLNEEIYQ